MQYLLLKYISRHYNPNVIHPFELRDIFGTHFRNIFLEYFWKEIIIFNSSPLSHHLNISCKLLRVTFKTSALLHLCMFVLTHLNYFRHHYRNSWIVKYYLIDYPGHITKINSLNSFLISCQNYVSVQDFD